MVLCKARKTILSSHIKKGMVFTTVLVYVDDMLIVGNNNPAIEELKEYLHLQFHMADLGELKYF